MGIWEAWGASGVASYLIIVYSAVLFAMQAMRIKPSQLCAGCSEFKGLEFVLCGGLFGADGHDLVGAQHTYGNQVLALGFSGFLVCGTSSQ